VHSIVRPKPLSQESRDERAIAEPNGLSAPRPVVPHRHSKPYRSRLLWRHRSRKAHSTLLLTAPEDVLAIAIRGVEGATVITILGILHK
jgi:hypothetical protein